MALEGFDGSQHHIWTVRNDLEPGFPARTLNGRDDEPKRAAARICADEEILLTQVRQPAGMMVGVVFVVVFAWRNQLKLPERIVCAQIADFAGGVACRGEQDVRAAARALDRNVKALVGFFVKQLVSVG